MINIMEEREHNDEQICGVVNRWRGGKGGQKVIKEGSETTGGGMFGQNKSTEERVIGIRGEGDNRRVDFSLSQKQTAFVVV